MMPLPPTGSNLRSHLVFALVSLFLGFAGRAISAPSEDWSLVKRNSRDYVTIKDLATFYRFELKPQNGLTLLTSPTIDMQIKSGSDRVAINGVNFYLSYPAIRSNGDVLISRMDLCKLIDPVLRPSYIRKSQDFTTVVIDPGHGGVDSGTIGLLAEEKIYTLDLAKKLHRQLFLRGVRARFTREGDEKLTLRERVRRANLVPNAVFVSLHFNAHTSSQPKGIETYAITPPGAKSSGEYRAGSEAWLGNIRDSESIALAAAVHSSVLKATNAADRGVRRKRWHVLRGLKMPGILFEGGYITNPTESAHIDKDSYRVLLAQSMADAIVNFRAALQKAD